MSETNFLPSGPGDIPSMRPRPSGLPVLLFGALTTALALFIDFFAQQNDWNPMGWTLDYVLPAGAILIGLVASSGFGIASWKTGTKISGKLLAATLLILAAGYGCAEWLQYRREMVATVALGGDAMPFAQWFDATARSMRFVDEHDKVGEPLGLWGYAFRALELVGFMLGGLAIPFILRSQPFCDVCTRYMRSKTLAAMPFDLPKRLVRDQTPERQEERARLLASSNAGLAAITGAAVKDAASLREALAANGGATAKKAARIPMRVEVVLTHCQGCHRGTLKLAKVVPSGRSVQRIPLGQQELSPAVVEGLTVPGASLA